MYQCRSYIWLTGITQVPIRIIDKKGTICFSFRGCQDVWFQELAFQQAPGIPSEWGGGESPKKPRVHAIFAGPSGSSSSTPTLDSRPTTNGSSTGPEPPVDKNHKFSFKMISAARMPRIQKEYGDWFVPSKDAEDLRTSYHLMDEGGTPTTPSKNRIIPSESDALRGS